MKKTIIVVAVFLSLNFAHSAYAYLDPGSGSMVLQVLLGGVAGVLLVIKLFWHRILEIFGIRKKEKSGETK